MLKIALVTADDAVAQATVGALSTQAVAWAHFSCVETDVHALGRRDFDVWVVDCSTPPAHEAVRAYFERQATKVAPTLALLSDADPALSVPLLNAGVDRCLPLSFDAHHFLAVVRALARRQQGLLSTVTQYGTLSFNHDTKAVHLQGIRLDLTVRETQVLETLLKRVGQIVAKDVFIEILDPERLALNTSAVEVYIHRLRKKIPDEVLPIRNIKRCGYFLRPFSTVLPQVHHASSSADLVRV